MRRCGVFEPTDRGGHPQDVSVAGNGGVASGEVGDPFEAIAHRVWMNEQFPCACLDGATTVEVGVEGLGEHRARLCQRAHDLVVQRSHGRCVAHQCAFGQEFAGVHRPRRPTPASHGVHPRDRLAGAVIGRGEHRRGGADHHRIPGERRDQVVEEPVGRGQRPGDDRDQPGAVHVGQCGPVVALRDLPDVLAGQFLASRRRRADHHGGRRGGVPVQRCRAG